MSTIKSTIVEDNRINANVSPPSKIVPKHVTLHNVSKADVGLSNVDDTRDLNKPISTATQTALDLKANQSTTYTKTQVNAELAAAESSRSSLLSSITAHANLTNNPHSVTATQVGLGNVDNESKAVMFTDPTFTGNPQSNAAPTSNDHLTNKTYVDTQVAGVVNSAPEALDTLNELAAALGDNANFATTTATSIGEKLAKASNLSDLANATTARTNLGLGNVEDKSSATIRSEIVDSDIPSTITRDSELSAHTALTNNPHSVTATQLNLENVTNESKTTMFSNPTFTGTVNTSEILSSQTSLAGLIIRGRDAPSAGAGGKVVIRGGEGGESEDADGNVEIGLTNTNLVDLGSTRASSLQVTGNITGVNLSGLLQSNNNKSVVIGELAAPSESAPNTEADPAVYRENIAIGYQALNATSTGTNNVAIGTDTLKSVSTGKNNIAIGKKALETGNSDRNIALGFNCLNVANVSTDNVVIGITNLQNTIAGSIQGNTIIGRNAGNSSNVGTGNFHDNVILGRTAFNSTTASKVEDCIFIGDKAGKSLKGIGDNDIGIGRNAFFGSNDGFTSGGNNIAIGQNTQSNSTVFTRVATAKVNGATSDTTALVVDNNSGNGLIVVGMVVAGTGISGTPTVITVTDQNNLVLSSAQTLSNNTDLTFTTSESITGSIKIGADGGKAGSHSVNISTVDTSAAGADGAGTREVNDITGSHSGLIAGYDNSIAAETAFIGAGHRNTIATSATGAAILGGFDNEITGVGSAGMALGSNLTVQGANQVVIGRFNVGNNNSKFIVGSGFSNENRINAFEVKNNHQIKLGKYGTTNFTYDGSRNFNILAVGAANNVVEIPLHDDKLDSQFLNTTELTVSNTGFTPLNSVVEKILDISWTGSTGTAQINLPQSSNFVKRTIRFVTDGTIPDDGIVHIKPSGSDTLEGLTSGIKLRGKHQSAMVWSDGVSNYSNIGLDSSAVKFDETDTDPVTKIRKMDQLTYDGLVTAGTVDANTLYIIVG